MPAALLPDSAAPSTAPAAAPTAAPFSTEAIAFFAFARLPFADRFLPAFLVLRLLALPFLAPPDCRAVLFLLAAFADFEVREAVDFFALDFAAFREPDCLRAFFAAMRCSFPFTIVSGN